MEFHSCFLTKDHRKRYQKGFDIAKYINNHIYMFGSDNPITAKLLLKQSSAAKYVKEWFNDNARVEKKDGWALLRASNTGPNLTLRFEAKTKKGLEEIQNEFMAVLEIVQKGK